MSDTHASPHQLVGISEGTQSATWYCSCGVSGRVEPSGLGEKLFERARTAHGAHARSRR